MAPAPFRVRRLDDYVAKLEKAKVVLDPERRKEIILADAKNLAFAQGYELIEDAGLLAEVAGLVEWPVVLMGSFDESVPVDSARGDPHHHPHQPEMLRAARSAGPHRLANKFILVSNIEAEDGGKAIVAGNERVIRARLSRREILLRDRPQDPARRPAAEIRADRVPRKARHAGGAHRAHRAAGGRACADGRRRRREDKARRAAVQGRPAHRSGRRIPRAARADGKILRAGAGRGRSGRRTPCEDHYKPNGPDDRVPPIRCRLRSRWPTRSIRWSASGRSTRSQRAEGPICAAPRGVGRHSTRARQRASPNVASDCECLILPGLTADRQPDKLCPTLEGTDEKQFAESRSVVGTALAVEASRHRRHCRDLLAFFADRLKVQLREQGARHDLVDAVFALEGQDDLVLIVRRVEALGKFLDTDDGKNLLAGYKRATNILRIEEKKDARRICRRARSAVLPAGRRAGARACDRHG